MRIHRLRSDDWAQYSDLRLAGLADTPQAFGESLDHARSCTERDWRDRLSRMQGERALGLVAVADDGSWAGTMRGGVSGDDAWLYGVYVLPRHRRTGVARMLLTSMSDWATPQASRMLLHVATTNVRARRFYERNAFAVTGRSTTNPAHPHLTELEMSRLLRA
ncbi:GNAT family N-acetyltransferase [Williamsia maris]|uniref:Ribosomal protein S18 acetylase RimI n=1 Tax=Williamsia maris TaxID=72806 RepID=A0ABT1HIG5_9NOCA|nr:GNAT family N-acetyltransferase [Williamsia maris]MCP2177661.1 Ribosomal protein S18 acetylase RimI [Williamsia maris]